MGQTVGGAMGAQAEFKPFKWQGVTVNTEGFAAEGGNVVDSFDAGGVRAKLNLSALKRGVWEISDVNVKRLEVVTNHREGLANPTTRDHRAKSSNQSTQVDSKGFFAGFLPDKSELLSLNVESMDWQLLTSAGELDFSDVSARADAGSGEGMYDISLQGGSIASSWLDTPIELKSARCKYQGKRLFITEFTGSVYERGLLSINGEVSADDYGFYTELTDVKLEELLPEGLSEIISGEVSAECNVSSASGSAKSPKLKGKVELENGVLKGFALLDRIAAYTNTERFSRLNLSECQMNFAKDGEQLELTNIVLASEGLIRIKGKMNIVSRKLDGKFRVGVMPGLLAHIPGAETKVFSRGEDGLLWTDLRVTGTLDQPKEDLSKRMIEAAYLRMFELIPETGVMALKFAHDTATDLPAGVLKSLENMEDATDVIREGTDVIKSGVGAGIDGLLNLMP